VESLKVYTELMSVLGDLLSLMADIEIKYGKGINDVVKEAISPPRPLELSRSIPPELFTRFMSLLLKMGLISSQTQNIFQLSPNEKRLLAKELKELSKELSSIIEKINRYLSSSKE
jgi:hypothetical protein